MIKKRFSYSDFIDRVSFKQIFGLWIFIILLFGILFFALNSYTEAAIIDNKGDDDITLFTMIYFSFVTATTTGYGDIIPVGFGRLFAILEVIAGLMIYGVLISKLVSAKQEVILEEIYDISFDEKINRIRSALYLFRADVGKTIERIENNTISKHRINDLWITFTTLETHLYEITKLIRTRGKNKYVKHVDDLNIELILNSISLSLSKAMDLFEVLDEKKIEWRNDMMNSIVDAIPVNVDSIQQYIKSRESQKSTLIKADEVVMFSNQLKTRWKEKQKA